MLNDIEKDFLRDLRFNETWNGILTKISRSDRLRWRKDRSSEEWAYESGRVDENEAIINKLRGIYE